MNQKNNKYHSLYKLPSKLIKAVYNLRSKKVKLVKLKNWQLKAHLKLRDASLGFIVAPCGAGKTILMRSIGAYKTFVTGKRAVFSVPRNDIGKDGFANYLDIKIPLGNKNKTLNLSSPHNLCHEKAESKIDELIDLLLKDPLVDDAAEPNYIGRFHQIVCTHQSLTLAIRKIKHDPEKLKKFVSNNAFFIDEGHHIKGKETYSQEDIEDLQAMNLLGEFVNFLLDTRSETSAELFIVTATPYRGDFGSILSYEQLKEFVAFELDKLEHFLTLGIKQVGMGLEEYENIDDLVKRVVHNIGLELDHYHLVFVPPTGRKWRKEKHFYKILIDAIQEMLISKLGADIAKDIIIDLVDESTQNYNDALLRREPKSGDSHKPKIRIAIACMKCREGSDWCPADRIHNTSMEESPTLIAQTNGRLHRYFPGKNDIKIQYYAEKFKTLNNDKREFVSDRVNCILYFMIADDLYNPIILDIPSPVSESEKDEKSPSKKNKSTLEEIFSTNYQLMKSDLLKSVAEVNFTEKAVDQIISLIMEKHLPKRYPNFTKTEIEEIRMGLKAFLLRARSSELRSMGVDISFIRKRGFDKVVEEKSLYGNMFTCDLDGEDLKAFNELVKKQPFTEEQIRFVVEGIQGVVSDAFGEEFDEKKEKHVGMAQLKVDFFLKLHNVYNRSSGTKNYSLEGISKILRKPVDYVEESIKVFNSYCLPENMKFDFSDNSLLAQKKTPLMD